MLDESRLVAEGVPAVLPHTVKVSLMLSISAVWVLTVLVKPSKKNGRRYSASALKKTSVTRLRGLTAGMG